MRKRGWRKHCYWLAAQMGLLAMLELSIPRNPQSLNCGRMAPVMDFAREESRKSKLPRTETAMETNLKGGNRKPSTLEVYRPRVGQIAEFFTTLRKVIEFEIAIREVFAIVEQYLRVQSAECNRRQNIKSSVYSSIYKFMPTQS
jgi:hypothetical protein